jgi:2-polyprenyl-3-methyl-5-hydroxy-6-metoxy-1,4-benzoquinol methylase
MKLEKMEFDRLNLIFVQNNKVNKNEVYPSILRLWLLQNLYLPNYQLKNKTADSKAKTLSETENLQRKIHEANIAVHKIEVTYYEIFHPEVYGKQEQKRISTTLNQINSLISNDKKKALDFGAGTGNLTGKLLALGYEVTAVDISPDMCNALRKKYQKNIQTNKLTVINSPIENVEFNKTKFDLITCYSVLHHLPDYVASLQKLTSFLKKGGIIYLDHEASPNYWKTEPKMLTEIVKTIYLHSNPIINALYFRLINLNIPTVDYAESDYWHKKEHPLDHSKIQTVFKTEKFENANRTDYHQKGTWIPNPIYPIFKLICKPEMSCWIAKK